LRQRQDEAYVVDTRELGEADLIVTLVAENAGRVRGVAPSARRSRRRFGGTLEPMTRVKASWVEREGRDLHRIETLELARSYATMQADPLRHAACAVLAEIAAAIAREEQPDPKGFRLLGAVLDALESGLDAWVAIRYFEYWMLRLHGVLPDLAHCGVCGNPLGPGGSRFAGSEGDLRCATCAKESGRVRKLHREDLSFLDAAATLPPAKMAAHRQASRPGGAIESLLRGALEAFVEKRFRTYRHVAAAEGRP
jgi:DNA repair protein RecO (recombination protein O)